MLIKNKVRGLPEITLVLDHSVGQMTVLNMKIKVVFLAKAIATYAALKLSLE